MLDAEIFVRSKNHPPRTIPEKVDLANQAVQILALSLVLVRIPATLLVVLLCIQRQREDVGLWKVLYGPQVSLNWCLIWEIWVSSATINPLHFCGRTVQSMVGLACVNAQYWQVVAVANSDKAREDQSAYSWTGCSKLINMTMRKVTKRWALGHLMIELPHVRVCMNMKATNRSSKLNALKMRTRTRSQDVSHDFLFSCM